MRTIGVVTVGRSDYGAYQPVLRRIEADPELKLWMFVGGMHLEPEFGLTVKLVEADGFEIRERVEMGLVSDAPAAVAHSMGLGVSGFARALARSRPDVLVLLGDRFDMFTAAVAALPLRIPVAHIHGGELTRGAIDDALRHCLTKLSHLHFVSTREYARRVAQLGEEEWRITVSGAPVLDHLLSQRLLSRGELEKRYELDLSKAPLLVTLHPVTLEHERSEWQAGELLAALERSELPVVFTAPNADPGGEMLRTKIQDYVRTHDGAQWVENLGTEGYHSLMALALAMVGNSSSGLLEAPSFKLPVVNIGTRQADRTRAANVIDVDYDREAILAGIRRALREEFRQALQNLVNPYGDGHASVRIVDRLREVPLDQQLIVKRFRDIPESDPGVAAARKDPA